MIDPTVLIVLVAALAVIVAMQAAYSVRLKRTHAEEIRKIAVSTAKGFMRFAFVAERELQRRVRTAEDRAITAVLDVAKRLGVGKLGIGVTPEAGEQKP